MSVVGIIVGLLIIGLMMLVHESGHFFAGRWLKFKILEFSIFMGPRLFTTEKDGIKYSFRLLPLGASVQFAGEHIEEAETDLPDYDPQDPGLFFRRPRWARAIVVACGPLANFLTALIAFIIMFSIFGTLVPVLDQIPNDTLAYESGLEAGDRIISVNRQNIHTTVDYAMIQAFADPRDNIEIEAQTAEGQKKTVILKPQFVDRYRMGITQQISDNNEFTVLYVDPESNQGNPVLKEGDKLLEINHIPYQQTERISEILKQDQSTDLTVKVERDGQILELEMVTTLYHDPLPDGIYFTESKRFGDIIYQSVFYPISIVKSTIQGFAMIFQGQVKFSESVTGPVGIVKMFGDAVSDSPDFSAAIYKLLFYFGMISVAIGFTNLLPIPPLDGHHLLILAIEGIIRKDLPQKFKHVVAVIGMILILLLAVFVIFIDIKRII